MFKVLDANQLKIRVFSLFVIFLQSTFHMAAQSIQSLSKPVIDTSAFSSWPSVGVPTINSTGRFTFYTIFNQPKGNRTLILKDVNSRWITEWIGAHSAAFSEDQEIACFLKSNDTLCIVKLGNANVEYISNVNTCKIFKVGGVEWLVYNLNSKDRKLFFRSLKTNTEVSFSGVISYWHLNGSNKFIFQTVGGNQGMESVSLVDIQDNAKLKLVWKGNHASNFIFDNSGKGFAFTEDNGTFLGKSIFYFKEGMEVADELINKKGERDSSLVLKKINGFSKDDRMIFFEFKRKENPHNRKLDRDIYMPEIWSYNDPKLQSLQMHEMKGDEDQGLLSVINIKDRMIVKLLHENERMISHDNNAQYVFILNEGNGDSDNEWYWNVAAQKKYFLVSINDGHRIKINDRKIGGAWFSPEGKFVIYYDPLKRNYFSYNVSLGVIINITESIKTVWTASKNRDMPLGIYEPIGLAGFLPNDSAVLIYDRNDIWQISLTGSRAVNVTNNYGKKQNIVFRLAINHYGKTFASNEYLILSAYNSVDKSNGFYSIYLSKKGDPIILTMGQYVYTGPPEQFLGQTPKAVIVNNKVSYILNRMKSSESGNWFYTRDFKNFLQLTDFYPERKYNWLYSELIKFKVSNGDTLSGVLYKPENFDSGKRYPVILNYYERKTDLLNVFQRPNAMADEINIPYFVSNGYLVFTPDIAYEIGKPGKSAYDAIIASYNLLSNFPFVDNCKVGLQGHSFGGFETNYIIAHTTVFAAAQSAASMCNFISAYGSIIGDGSSRQRQYEVNRDRIGGSLWEKRESYIENSPVLQADKISTPLLLMHNKDDYDVPFSQSLELFTAMRRLGKKVWMLQYDREGHSIDNRRKQLDYTIRTMQFFDYYLRGMPAPKWMIFGVPYSERGGDGGFELLHKEVPSSDLLFK